MKRILLTAIIFMTVISASFGKSSPEKSNTLRVGMDLKYFPFTGTDNNGKPTGIEVDIANALGQYLGKEVEIVNTDFPMLIPALQSNNIDIVIGSMSITAEREETVDFSKPYLYDKLVALVNKDFAMNNSISDEMDVDSLFAVPNAKFIGIAGSISITIPQAHGVDVKSVTTEAAAEREIVTGSADILVGAYNLYGMHDTNRNTTVMYKRAIELSETGMAVKDGNSELLAKVNEFIDQMEKSGLNNTLKTKWDSAIKKKLFDDKISLDYYLYQE